MNNLVIGIGGSGSNIASFIKKQNNPNLEVIAIENKDQIDDIDFKKEQNIFTISALGGDSSGDIALSLTQKAKENEVNIKNIIILPFSVETNKDKVNDVLIKLQSINPNIEVFANDSISENKNISILQIMQLMDEKIYDRVSRENQIKWKSFFIEQVKNDIVYKAFVQYWSKDYKIVLVNPEFKVIDISHMPNMAPSKFAMHNEIDDSFIDIEDVAINCLSSYIKNM